MSIIVMGVGPVGGIIGGRLAKAGSNVTFVDVNPEHVRAIRERGLEVDVPDGPFKVSVPILFPEEITGRFDLAFVAVRSYNTSQVLSSLDGHLEQGAVLVSLQNGMNPPLLEERVGPDHAIGTVVRMGSRLTGPGRVETRVRGQLYIGHLHGRTTARLTSAHTLLNSVIPTEMTTNIYGLLWSKLTYTCLGTLGALADVPFKTVWQSERNRGLTVAFMAEVVGVGVAGGVSFEALKEYNPLNFHPSRPYESRHSTFTEAMLRLKTDEHSGIAIALKRGVKTEVDYTVGYVIREGEKTGIRTPICRALVALVHEIENGKRPLQLENYEELPAD